MMSCVATQSDDLLVFRHAREGGGHPLVRQLPLFRCLILSLSCQLLLILVSSSDSETKSSGSGNRVAHNNFAGQSLLDWCFYFARQI
ncbi:MAG: hypothetical protein KKF24_16195 [Gammaproteobacteria bacterium]|nr:hypothetical protein [Gammaproteobacteria bacterium]MBU1834226.1 hypothetical protein [Gammaproteobacteria bacterium]